jgi:site-specific DNA recombinase
MVLDGYVRVSRVHGRSGEGFISPAVQREQIERWAELRGAFIGHVFEELDESGGRRDRPLLMRAVERVERGESDGLVVAYLSRFGRSQLDGLTTIERITRAGGVFFSVQQGLDFSTDVGRHMLREMLSWAELELDRTRSTWATARERAIARGVCIGPRPFGYLRTASGRLSPDPVEGPLVTELYRRRAAGARIMDLRDLLRESGVPTARGNAWNMNTVRVIVKNRVYLGEVHHGEFINPKAHAPLVDEDTWNRAQLLPHRLPPRRGKETPLLRGILRCAGCQRLLQTCRRDVGTRHERLCYLCRALRQAGTCPAPVQVNDSLVEPYVEALFWQELSRAKRQPAARRLERLKQEVDRRVRELEAYRDNDRLPTTIGPNRFARGLAVRARRLEQARLELSRAQVEASTPRLPSLGELRQQWPSMSLDQRRAAIAQVIDCAFVTDAIRRGIEARLYVCAPGRAPAGLPPPNPRGPLETRPFDPSTCAPSLRLRKSADWSDARLRSELRRFLAGRTRWPSFPEFQSAGKAALHEQVERHGGPRRWAELFNVPYHPPPDQVGTWSKRRIRRELATYLKDKARWPSCRTFAADGQGQLRKAIRWFGGPEYWAREFGLDLPPRYGRTQRWTYARIKSELLEFVGDRPDWPALSEFEAAGLNKLYNAIRASGARERLAAELGLWHPQGRVYARPQWPHAAIKAALDDLLAGRTTWPSQREFRLAGLSGLYGHLYRTRGRDMWAREYGVRVRPGRPDTGRDRSGLPRRNLATEG